MQSIRAIEKIEVTVIVPALNEEKNIADVIKSILDVFRDYKIKGEIVVVNDGSIDGTKELVCNMIKRDNRIRLINHQVPLGIGASFWDGVDNAYGTAIVYFPGDNENIPGEVFRYYSLLEHVDIVVPFVFNEEMRSKSRNMFSSLFRFIINVTFFTNFNYTNGTVLYRKSILNELNHRSNSFFFQTDILIRTVKKGYLFAEVPYKLGIREHGVSRAISFFSLLQITKGYLRLIKDIYFRGGRKRNEIFSEVSLAAKRRGGN